MSRIISEPRGTLMRFAIAAWLGLLAQAAPSQPTQTQAQPVRAPQRAAPPTRPAPTPTDGSWLAEERGPFATSKRRTTIRAC